MRVGIEVTVGFGVGVNVLVTDTFCATVAEVADRGARVSEGSTGIDVLARGEGSVAVDNRVGIMATAGSSLMTDATEMELCPSSHERGQRQIPRSRFETERDNRKNDQQEQGQSREANEIGLFHQQSLE